jgi:hypothetical protein
MYVCCSFFLAAAVDLRDITSGQAFSPCRHYFLCYIALYVEFLECANPPKIGGGKMPKIKRGLNLNYPINSRGYLYEAGDQR